jgi:hypothetical protein
MRGLEEGVRGLPCWEVEQWPGEGEAVGFGEEGWQWVGGVEAFRGMVQVLSGEKEIAVDLEHHSEHSYVGLTCLLQISTASRDYVVDPLALWDHMP